MAEFDDRIGPEFLAEPNGEPIVVRGRLRDKHAAASVVSGNELPQRQHQLSVNRSSRIDEDEESSGRTSRWLGEIGPHEAGLGQLFFAVQGAGWVAGGDAIRLPLATGQAALIDRGEVHSKGSDTGLTALMIQICDLNWVDP